MNYFLSPENWKFYSTVIEGERLLINGLNIWDFNWESLNYSIAIEDPSYGKLHTFNIYQITSDNTTVQFAAGEFSNLVWGVYLQIIESKISH